MAVGETERLKRLIKIREEEIEYWKGKAKYYEDSYLHLLDLGEGLMNLYKSKFADMEEKHQQTKCADFQHLRITYINREDAER